LISHALRFTWQIQQAGDCLSQYPTIHCPQPHYSIIAMGPLRQCLYDQVFVTPVLPNTDCTGRTIIVTGANTGLGKEAARHIVKLNAERVIITSRTASKGEAAAKDIEQTTGRKGVVEVWDLDLQDYDNVKAFAERVKTLKRLDAIIENAGMSTMKYTEVAGNESTITTNVVSTFLLALLVFKRQQESTTSCRLLPSSPPTCTILPAYVPYFDAYALSTMIADEIQFPERKSANIFDTLNDPKKARMHDRYNVSKLLEIFTVRHIARNHPVSQLHVTLNTLTPGLCESELLRDNNMFLTTIGWFIKKLFARTTEVGSRTLVHAGVAAGEETHGKFMSTCSVLECAALVEGPEGRGLEDRVWNELSEKLEAIQPGVTKNLGA
jgi:retinol dehydrogenase-12